MGVSVKKVSVIRRCGCFSEEGECFSASVGVSVKKVSVNMQPVCMFQ